MSYVTVGGRKPAVTFLDTVCMPLCLSYFPLAQGSEYVVVYLSVLQAVMAADFGASPGQLTNSKAKLLLCLLGQRPSLLHQVQMPLLTWG